MSSFIRSVNLVWLWGRKALVLVNLRDFATDNFCQGRLGEVGKDRFVVSSDSSSSLEVEVMSCT